MPVKPARGRLLVYYVDPAQAAQMSARLRAAGVLVEVDSVDPHVVQPSKSGSTRIGLWVLCDDQFEDAIKLLKDPSHRPQRVIGAEQMQAAGRFVGTTPGPGKRGPLILLCAIFLARSIEIMLVEAFIRGKNTV